MNPKQNDLAGEKLSVLMRRYALPCIISLLVGALYNIVDQNFIANADYLGSYGNAASNVVFPLTVAALAVMIGDGACAFVSISLGMKKDREAAGAVGNALVLLVSLVLTAVYALFRVPILTAFGARVNGETFRLSLEYFTWITAGIPAYMLGQCLNPVIRSDGSPRFAMAATVSGALFKINSKDSR